MQLIVNKLKNIINVLENYQISILSYIIIFFSICFIRNFLEVIVLNNQYTFSQNQNTSTIIFQIFVLYNLEWMTLFIYIVILIYLLTKNNIISIFKITLLFFNIIIIVPILNFFIYLKTGCAIDYLYTIQDYIKALLYFFFPFKDVKVCAGIRIEVFISILFIFIYIFLKTNNIYKSFLGSFVLYFLAISSMAFPVFILIPFYPFNPIQYNLFVNNFFFVPSFLDSFLNKFAIMIFFLLMPAFLIVYKIYYKNKKFLLLIKNIFSLETVSLFLIILFGFIINYELRNLFTSLFNIFFVFFIFIFCCLLHLYFQNHNFTVKNISFVLLILASLSISINNFFILLFICSVHYILNYFNFFNKIIYKFLIYLFIFYFLITFGNLIVFKDNFIKINIIIVLIVVFCVFIYLHKQLKYKI